MIGTIFVDETLTYRQIERWMKADKENKGVRWLSAFYKSIGVESIIASGMEDAVISTLEEMGEDRTKVWRAKKMFAEWR